jgi:hypothetical protein
VLGQNILHQPNTSLLNCFYITCSSWFVPYIRSMEYREDVFRNLWVFYNICYYYYYNYRDLFLTNKGNKNTHVILQPHPIGWHCWHVKLCICWFIPMCGEMIHDHSEGKRVVNLCVSCTYLLPNVNLSSFWSRTTFVWLMRLMVRVLKSVNNFFLLFHIWLLCFSLPDEYMFYFLSCKLGFHVT